MEKKNTWETYSSKQLKELEKINAQYRDFLDNGKTERECIDTIVNTIEKSGYRELESLIKEGAALKTGDKVYSVWMNKSIAMFQIGRKPMTDGMNILGAHIDSPRLDVKQNPLYEDGGFAYLDTHYYGGVKKYQWVTIPLAIHGVIVKKDGTCVEINIGENEDDPVFFVSDLLIHLAQEQLEKKAAKVIEGEALDIIVGKGPSANSIRLDLPHCTLIGATTRAGQLSAPLRDRFGVTLRLELYTPEELSKIVTRSAGILNCDIVPEGAYEIARRSRGTPRIANRMLRRVRDFADVKADGIITKQVADEALCALEIDYLGLDPVDRRMMAAIIENYNGGPVGLETLAATIGEESVTLEDVYEPYLMQLGFLTRTPRGRCVTQKAYQHLHKPIPGGAAEGPLMDQLTF